jgi:hypothetical protein
MPTPTPTSVRTARPGSASRGRRRVGLVLTLAVVLIVVAGGGFVLITKLTAPKPVPTPPPVVFNGDPRTLLLVPPESSFPVKNTPGDAGALDADQVANLYADAEQMRARLDADHFRSGAIVQWMLADNTMVSIKLYAFADATGAGQWASAEATSYTDNPKMINHSPIGTINTGALIVMPTPTSRGQIQTIAIAVKHNVAMKIYVYQDHQADETVITSLAQQQYARMP